MDRQTTVLLGAGASKEAGIKLANEMSEHLLKKLNEGHLRLEDPDALKALNFTYGSIVGHTSRTGASPLQGVNIEKFISALRLLQDRHTHEAAPFVSTWSAGADGFRHVEFPLVDNSEFENALREAIGLDPLDKSQRTSHPRRPRFKTTDALQKEVARIALKATTTSGSRAFRTAEKALLDALAEHLEDIQGITHLKPLVDYASKCESGLDVITLNYDRSVEIAAEGDGIKVERGLANWRPGVALDFGELKNTLRLYKLHGSVDWTYRPGESSIDPPSIETRDVRKRATSNEAVNDNPGEPWIVVGDREKLSADGPILALLQAAELALNRSEHLLVAGYSFRDPHVNHMIRNWLAGDTSRQISVIDPRWPATASPDDFRSLLMSRYGDDSESAPRFHAYNGPTSTCLGRALSWRPHPLDSHAFDIVSVSRSEDSLDIGFNYRGPDLRQFRISLAPPVPEEAEGVIFEIQRRESKSAIRPILDPLRRDLDWLNGGSSFVVRIYPSSAVDSTLKFECYPVSIQPRARGGRHILCQTSIQMDIATIIDTTDNN